MTVLPRSPAPEILVVEREPFWRPELQRRFPDVAVVAWEAAERESPAAAEIPAGRGRLLVITGECLIPRLAEWRPLLTRASLRGAPVLALLRRGELAWEWPLRELGVTAVLDEFIGGRTLAAACERLLAQAIPAAANTP